MEFHQPLESLLSISTTRFEYYRKQVLCETYTDSQTGELIRVSSDGSVTFDFGDKEHQHYHIKHITDIRLLNQEPTVSIKDKISDIVFYKVVQDLVHTLCANTHLKAEIEPLSIKNRNEYLNTRTDPAKKSEISQNILNMKVIEPNDGWKSALDKWKQDGGETHTIFTQSDLVSLLNAFRMLWIHYLKQHTMDQDCKVDANDESEQKTYASYLQWDNWTIDGTAAKDATVAHPNAEDIYLKYVWPHCLHGPYYKVLNSAESREWKCKKCNKSPADKVKEWYKDGVISTCCNVCGTKCDPQCNLARGADLSTCSIAGTGGCCNVCLHSLSDHEHVGWKYREVVKDNEVTEKGRIKYYKTKRTVFTYEMCHSCVEKAKKSQIKKDKAKIDKLREKRKERRKNEGKKQDNTPVSPMDKAPTMEFMDIIIDAKAKGPSRSVPKKAKKPPVSKPRVVLSQKMRNDVSVRAALCIIPPEHLWPKIQEIRIVHDPAYTRWMPHLNIFFPFVDEKYFDDISRYIEEDIVKKNNIRAFDIELKTFDVFDRIKQKLGRSNRNSKVAMETLFLNPSGCDEEMQRIFKCLKRDWPVCANKHGGGFSPHLTVGKIRLAKMLNYQRHFQANWQSLSWKCNAIYLISRRGKDPFVIRHTIPLC
eukprot:33016_1